MCSLKHCGGWRSSSANTKGSNAKSGTSWAAYTSRAASWFVSHSACLVDLPKTASCSAHPPAFEWGDSRTEGKDVDFESLELCTISVRRSRKFMGMAHSLCLEPNIISPDSASPQDIGDAIRAELLSKGSISKDEVARVIDNPTSAVHRLCHLRGKCYGDIVIDTRGQSRSFAGLGMRESWNAGSPGS